jgi:phage-related tail protein
VSLYLRLSAASNDQKIASIEAALASTTYAYEDVQKRLGTANDAEMPALRLQLQDQQRSLAEKEVAFGTLQREMDAQARVLEAASKK